MATLAFMATAASVPNYDGIDDNDVGYDRNSGRYGLDGYGVLDSINGDAISDANAPLRHTVHNRFRDPDVRSRLYGL